MPELIELVFHFQVVEAPDDTHQLFRVDARPEDPTRCDFRYSLFFRPDPFSLARIDATSRSGEETLATNGVCPYLARARMRIAADFPLLPSSGAPVEARLELDGAGERLIQTIEPTSGGVRITLEISAVRVVIEWLRGDRWWSTFERTIEIGLGPERQTQSAGRLLHRT
jgi:hypothetical protein